ncbi:MAG TPA: acyltransferase [Nocardioides sp.]|nr:acyltransferase [Nocardioides sp.]
MRRQLNHFINSAWRWIERHGDVGPGSRMADTFGSFGRGSCLAFPQATVLGAAEIHIGEASLIGKYSTLSVGYPIHSGPLPPRGLVIGDRCVIGARACITAHESIEIGDDVWLGQDVFISDASHGYTDPDVPIGLQFGECRPVRIGAGTWIGHGAMILPGTTIGRNVVVAAGSVVRGDVPDHTVVGGVPARTIRSYEGAGGWVAAASLG